MARDTTTPPPDETPRGAADLESPFDLAGAALGAVAPDELAEVEAAVAADPALRREFDTLQGVAAELAWLVPPAIINPGHSAGIRSRLVARAGSSHRGRAPGLDVTPAGLAPTPGAGATPRNRRRGREDRRAHPPAPPPPPMHVPAPGEGLRRLTERDLPARGTTRSSQRPGGGGRSTTWMAIAAAIVIAIGLGVGGVALWRASQSRQAQQTAAVTRDSALRTQIAALRGQVASRDSMIAALTGPQTRVIDMVDYRASGPEARMFWDQRSNEWMMFAHHMRQPGQGKTYQLWLIARGNPAPISAGTFTPDASGSAVMHARYDMPPGTLQRIAVTEEPAGGMPAPTGPIVMVGAGR